MAVAPASTTIRNLRLSKISASAPAGTANRNIGSVVAACTRETARGSGLRLVMSQPEAALYIQVPILATTVAVHSTANVRWRNGAQADGAEGEAGPALVLIAISKTARRPEPSGAPDRKAAWCSELPPLGRYRFVPANFGRGLQPVTSVWGRSLPSDSSSCQWPFSSSYEMPVVLPGTTCSLAARSAALRAKWCVGKVSEYTPFA